MDKSKNKSFIVNNGSLLRKYALENYNNLGAGIIVVNLFLLEADTLNASDFNNYESQRDGELIAYQIISHPVSYIPKTSFWFKILSLKIKEKHQIDITVNNSPDKFLVVFIKDASIEHFSIYSLNT